MGGKNPQKPGELLCKFASKGNRVPFTVISGASFSYKLPVHRKSRLKDVITESDGSLLNYCSDAHSVGKNQIVATLEISWVIYTLKPETR